MKRQTFYLSSGSMCFLESAEIPHSEFHFVIVFEGVIPTDQELGELMVLANRQASLLAEQYLGNADCYSIYLNGAATRSVQHWHCHIHLFNDRADKAKMFRQYADSVLGKG
jgi:hypothetical protein